MTETKQNNNKKYLSLLLVFALICGAVLGTMAWLTSDSSVQNNFKVGQITDPKPDIPEPDLPTPDPDPDLPTNKGKLEGNIYEPSWGTDEDYAPQLVPGKSIAKDPYIGIGPNSEASYVYVYVQNTISADDVYFVIDSTNWEAVDGHVHAVDGVENGYSYGLFKYKGVLAHTESDMSKNVWTTTPLFKKVTEKVDIDQENFTATSGAITVNAYLHQAYDTTKAATDEAYNLATTAATGAVTWAAQFEN